MKIKKGNHQGRLKPLIAALLGCGVIVGQSAAAATIVVTTAGDAGSSSTCTLRQAVLAANTDGAVGTCTAGSAGLDTISLAGLSGTIALASQIVVTGSVTMQGPGASTLAISGNHAHRIFDVVDTGSLITLSIDGLTLRDGSVTDENGGCIRAENSDHQSVIVVSNSIVSGCASTATQGNSAGGNGGAIFSDGAGQDKYANPSILLQNSTITGNSASFSGGGVAAFSSRLESSIVSNNLVSGFGSTAAASSKYGGGGGVFSYLVAVNNSTISGNQVSPTIVDFGSGTVGIGLGGGVVAAVAIVQNSTVSQNRISGTAASQTTSYNLLYGGGVAAFAAGQITGSTISGNIVSSKPLAGSSGSNPNWIVGGGVLVGDKYSVQFGINNSTIAGNRIEGNGGPADHFGAAGVAILSSGSSGSTRPVFSKPKKSFSGAKAALGAAPAAPPSGMQMYSSIVSNSVGGPDVSCWNFLASCLTPVIIAGDHNLVMNANTSVSLPSGTLTADPKLGYLMNNGGVVAGAPDGTGTGPNKTHGLLPFSPALDAGSIAVVPPPLLNPLQYDQRGPGFPRVLGAFADIGAVEGVIENPAPQVIPTLSSYALGLLSVLLAFFGRRRGSHPRTAVDNSGSGP